LAIAIALGGMPSQKIGEQHPFDAAAAARPNSTARKISGATKLALKSDLQTIWLITAVTRATAESC
jgi:hypothetical protein